MAAGDDSAEGRLRLIFSDASQTEKRVIQEYNTFVLDVSTDPRQQPIVPQSAGTIGEDDLLIMEYMPTAGTGDVATDPTESATHTLVQIPVTIRNVRTGNVYEKMLTSYDFNSSATNYTGIAAGTWSAIGTVTVSAQEQMKLGFAVADNSRIKVDLLTSA